MITVQTGTEPSLTGSNMSIALAVGCAAHFHEQGLRGFPKDCIIIPASSLGPRAVQWPCWVCTSNWHSAHMFKANQPTPEGKMGKRDAERKK